MQLSLPFELPDVLCEHCREPVPQPFYVVRHYGTMTRQHPFCNETCANEYYMEKLRRTGL